MRKLLEALASERLWQWVHAMSALFWVALIWPTLMWWTESVPFLVFASIWANVVGHAGGALSARAGRRSNPDDPL